MNRSTQVLLTLLSGLIVSGCTTRAATEGPDKPSSADQRSAAAAEAIHSADHPEASQDTSQRALDHPPELINSIGLQLRLIPSGTFTMGATAQDEDRWGDETPHEVTLPREFYLGAFEVTQEQYERVMGSHPSEFRGVTFSSGAFPVERVTWVEAAEFCQRLSELPEEKAAGRVYRLPTEAEWEFACRAGSRSAYSFGDDVDLLGSYAKYRENCDGAVPTGGKLPNAWGLYDMHGSVWEWCSDWYGSYPQQPVTNPLGPTEGGLRVYRGGCWTSPPGCCQSAARYASTPDYRSPFYGLRVALDLPQPRPAIGSAQGE